jgi:hypothetical protein
LSDIGNDTLFLIDRHQLAIICPAASSNGGPVSPSTAALPGKCRLATRLGSSLSDSSTRFITIAAPVRGRENPAYLLRGGSLMPSKGFLRISHDYFYFLRWAPIAL